ncbi:DUF1990 domain-containing protein [Brachybacterium sacelli]|uniref:Uncharacterized protein (UPF0548 family) n=1 Tax=Brachybacterium sacelli TaxID=173364 RepID=A0ABS4X035_9MICO|nr:DUF1990 domain-containing protein [Brachybacterium sacelli]MBP2381593.1 uncharacterized protein (UPF0548 family) [Brachybacterium sacelli]
MTSTTKPTWWDLHNDSLLAAARDDPSLAAAMLSDDIIALLAEVEAAFAETGTEIPSWEDPHLQADGGTRDSRDEEHGRCHDPGRFRILWTRAEAWTRVLTARGWAGPAGVEDGGQLDWTSPLFVTPHRATVLRPRRRGAEPLVLARTLPDDAVAGPDLRGEEPDVPGLVVGLGEPAVPVHTTPVCGCDACDDGSGDLLEDLDRTILSIVDGSFEVVTTAGGTSRRTSFGVEEDGRAEGDPASMQITAEPWAENWTPRPLCEPIDPGDIAWAHEMLREPWPTRLLDAVVYALPPPLAARIDRFRPGYSATATSSPYVRDDPEITAPLDALENVPAGYRRLHRSAVVTGMDFEEAATAVLTWTLQRRAGIGVLASHSPLEEGTEARLRLGIAPFTISAPCRVLQVIDEPDRQGFAYGTLPGHPESGIEQFTVTRTSTGLVRVHLDAVSRTATWYARLGAPAARIIQELITRRYLSALSSSSAP